MMTKIMAIILSTGFVLTFAGDIFADDANRNKDDTMVEDGWFKLKVSIYGLTNEYDKDTKTFYAGEGSIFTFEKRCKDGKEDHIIWFKKIKDIKGIPRGLDKDDTRVHEKASKKEFYWVSPENLKRMKYRCDKGIDHGTLFVPFKLQTRDGRLRGESSLGYYVGLVNEANIITTTLFGSAGVTIIPTSSPSIVTSSEDAIEISGGETQNLTGVTAAGGLAIRTKSGLQIAFVVGLDHVGGSEGEAWIYEDNPWVSFAIGFSFMRDH